MMGTTSTSGWAVFLFILGFTVLGTAAIGTGILGFMAGIAIIVGSGVMFKAARAKEEA